MGQRNPCHTATLPGLCVFECDCPECAATTTTAAGSESPPVPKTLAGLGFPFWGGPSPFLPFFHLIFFSFMRNWLIFLREPGNKEPQAAILAGESLSLASRPAPPLEVSRIYVRLSGSFCLFVLITRCLLRSYLLRKAIIFDTRPPSPPSRTCCQGQGPSPATAHDLFTPRR